MQDNKLPFSKTRTSDDLVFVSGQIPLTNEGTLLTGSVKEQVQQVMENIKSALESEGSSLSDVIKATIYVTNMSNYEDINEAYVSYLSEPYPARELVSVKELPLGAEIEISVIAKKPE